MKKAKVLFRLSVVSAALFAAGEVAALNIVLTNDDGWSSDGIQALKVALVNDGHTVFLVAPLNEQSGSSAAVNAEFLQVVKERDPSDEGAYEYSVAVAGVADGAEPATAAAVGAAIIQQATGTAADLVVAGVNAGQNLGAAAQFSGTVGAALAAVNSGLAGGRIPALAVSTDVVCADATVECVEANRAHFARVSDFVADLVAGLARGGHVRMPAGIGLNVNYPPLESVSGAVVARQGRTVSIGGQAISITYGCFGDCVGAATGVPVPAGITGFVPLDLSEIRNADTTKYEEGYITIVPIASNYTSGVIGGDESALRGFREAIRRILTALGY